MKTSRRTNTAFVLVLCAWCAGLASTASAAVVISSDQTYAQVYNGFSNPASNLVNTGGTTATITLPGYSSSTTSLFSTAGDSASFSATFAQSRGGILNGFSFGQAWVEFATTVDAPYVIGGSYSNSAGRTNLHGAIFDRTVGSYVFDNLVASDGVAAALSLGNTSGNAGNQYLVGSPTGNLLAGHSYFWYEVVDTEARPAADGGATAFGSASLIIGESPPFEWNGPPAPTAGAFDDGINWLPGRPPTPSDVVVFKRLGSSAVDFRQDASTSKLVVNNGQVAFNLAGHTYSAGSSAIVGQNSDDNAALTINGGTLTSASLSIAASSGSSGSVTIDGAGSTLRIAGRGGLYVGGTATQSGGTGTLMISNGGQVSVGPGPVTVWQQGTLNVQSTYDLATGTAVTSTLQADSIAVMHGGQVVGSGVIGAPFSNHGVLAPQGDYHLTPTLAFINAQIYVHGNFSQGDDGMLKLQVNDVNRSTAATPSYPLVVSGSASFGGALSVDSSGIATSVNRGDRFNLVSYNMVTSRFNNFTGTNVGFRNDVFFGLNYVQTATSSDAGMLQMIALETPRQYVNGLYQGHHLTAGQTTNNQLVLVTHGTSSSADDWVGTMAQSISSNAQAGWDVVAFDWSQYSGSYLRNGPAAPWVAANNGIDIGDSLANWLNQNFSYTGGVHLLGHSSGSWLVNQVASGLQSKDSGTPIQLTFFDAFTPGFGIHRVGAPDPLLGLNPSLQRNALFEEQIVDKYRSLPPGTNNNLPSAVNINVTHVDPYVVDPVAFHGWPYEWYQGTIQYNPNNIGAKGYNPWIDESWGFGHAVEHTGVFPSQSGQYAVGKEFTADAGGGDHFLAAIQRQSALQLDQVNHIVSSTGMVTFLADHSVTLATGSPVLLTEFVDLPTAANLFAFNFQFTSQADGLLSAYFDGNLLFDLDSQWLLDKSLLYSSGDIFLDSVASAGTHTLIFRLDPDGDQQAMANISNVQFGFADLQPVPEPSSMLLAAVGLAGLVGWRWRRR